MTDSIKAMDEQYIVHTYARFPIEIVRGKGSLVWDENGKEYIDMGTGIGVNCFGLADDIWAQAVSEQLHTCQHMSNLYYTQPCAKLARLLCERTNMSKVFFANSGAEANEGAIKAARRWSAQKYGPERYTIITLKDSFHGRTLATVAATGQDEMHQDFLPLTPGFVTPEHNNLEEIEALAAKNNCAAILFELVQGEGGVNDLPPEFVAGLADIAHRYGLLLICDEVQTGNGRTGKLYSYMHYDIQPDIITTAKGLGNGLPLGAILFAGSTAEALTPGTHGSTFGGNPACCAGALTVLERLDESFLAQVAAKGDYIRQELRGAPGITAVSGLGLMVGISTAKPVNDVLHACWEQGVLPLTAHGKLRLLPALNIPEDLLKQAVAIIKEVCAG